MWKIKGTIRYFLSMWTVTFVQMGIFIYIQQMIAGSNRGEVQDFRWESLLLQLFVLLPYVVFAAPASFLSKSLSAILCLYFAINSPFLF